jgi:hypothetical protein
MDVVGVARMNLNSAQDNVPHNYNRLSLYIIKFFFMPYLFHSSLL